jgi:hypothetical protein
LACARARLLRGPFSRWRRHLTNNATCYCHATSRVPASMRLKKPSRGVNTHCSGAFVEKCYIVNIHGEYTLHCVFFAQKELSKFSALLRGMFLHHKSEYRDQNAFKDICRKDGIECFFFEMKISQHRKTHPALYCCTLNVYSPSYEIKACKQVNVRFTSHTPILHLSNFLSI